MIVGASAQATLPASPERRYALREVKARLHHASFRGAVLTAYGGRGAISHLPEPRLLDAAHIVMDADEQLGQPVISNGLPLTKIHHAAFDAHLIGIDPDYRIHVSDRLFEIRDGPFLELGLKGIVGQVIELPRRGDDRPDRGRLALRFQRVQKVRLALFSQAVRPHQSETRSYLSRKSMICSKLRPVSSETFLANDRPPFPTDAVE